MQALIALAHPDVEHRFERALPPEHRIRARRFCLEGEYVELIVEGPMLPDVVDGVFQRGDMELTAHWDVDDGGTPAAIRIDATWRVVEQSSGLGFHYVGSWTVGRWPSHRAMMDDMQ